MYNWRVRELHTKVSKLYKSARTCHKQTWILLQVIATVLSCRLTTWKH